MTSIIQRRALLRIQDSGFLRAKKLADLALKTNVDGKGKTTARGYEQAIEILTPYMVSDGNEGIDAQRLVAGYTNSYTKMQGDKNKTNRTVGQFKVDEREIFYVTPTSGSRTDIMRDVPNMVSQVSDELNLHVFAVSNAIEEAAANNESTAELEAYLFDVQKRQRMMSELNNDYLNGEISPGQMVNGYGLYVDTDPNDGEMTGVMIAPIDDLPPGIDKTAFKRVDSSVNFGDAYIPVLGKVSTDGMGLNTVRIGNKIWDGTGAMELQYNKKLSQEPQYKNDPGAFTLENVTDKGVAMRPGTFSKGYTGFDAEGNPKQTTFYAGKDGKIYTLDDFALNNFKNDPLISKDIERATTVDSSFAKNLLQSESVEPVRFTPVTASRQQQMDEETATRAAAPAPAEQPS